MKLKLFLIDEWWWLCFQSERGTAIYLHRKLGRVGDCISPVL
jgi:hypothetical protein